MSIMFAVKNHLANDESPDQQQDKTVVDAPPQKLVSPERAPIILKVKDMENQTEKAANSEPKPFSDELSAMRTQLRDHYEAQIKALVKEIGSQKEVLEVEYAEKYKKYDAAQEEQLKAHKLAHLNLVSQLEQSYQDNSRLKDEIAQLKAQLSDSKSDLAQRDLKVQQLNDQIGDVNDQIQTAYTYMTTVKQANEQLKYELQTARDSLQQLQG